MNMLSEFKFHHIGIAVLDMSLTAQYYLDAGYVKTDNIIDPIQNIEISFLEKEGMPLIELLAAVNEKSPVNRIIKNIGVSPYHMCYQVLDIDDAVGKLKKKRFILVSKPSKARALKDKKICFLFHKHIGLIELLEQ